MKKQSTLFYCPFGPFSQEENPGEREVMNIESLIASKEWYQAREASARLIQTSLGGLRYLQTCVSSSIPPDWFFLRISGTTRRLSESWWSSRIWDGPLMALPRFYAQTIRRRLVGPSRARLWSRLGFPGPCSRFRSTL